MFRPLNNRVLILPDAKETTTSSGIILPEDSVEKPLSGTVVSSNSTLVNINDKVVFSRYGYDEVSYEGKDYYLVSETQLLGSYD